MLVVNKIADNTPGSFCIKLLYVQHNPKAQSLSANAGADWQEVYVLDLLGLTLTRDQGQASQ